MKNNKIPFAQLSVENSFLQFDEKYYDYSKITPLKDPKLASFNIGAAELLNIDVDRTSEEEVIAILNGEKL